MSRQLVSPRAFMEPLESRRLFDGSLTLDVDYTRLNSGTDHDAEITATGGYNATDGFNSFNANLSINAWEYPGPTYYLNRFDTKFTFQTEVPDLGGRAELIVGYGFGQGGEVANWQASGKFTFDLAGGDENVVIQFHASKDGGVNATIGYEAFENLNINVTGGKSPSGEYSVQVGFSITF